MECLSEKKLLDYIDNSLCQVENSLIRDHLITCDSCSARYHQYTKIEKSLNEPVFIQVPLAIEKFVMRRIYSKLPTYSSILTLIVLSFILLVSWIYVYFDFANNSIVQAFRQVSSNASNWIGSVISFISNFFSSVYALFKALNRAVEIIFNVNIGVEIMGVTTLIVIGIILYITTRMITRKLKGSNG